MSRWFSVRSDDAYDDEVNDLYLERQARQRYNNALARHPNPQDPDYPEGEDDEDQDE